MSWLTRCAIRSLRTGSARIPCVPPWQTRTYATVEARELTFGQPLHETHPHLVKAGELTPGITAIEYYKRRQALAELLPKNSVAIVPAGDLQYRPGSSAVFYDFHQDPDFLYLTGFLEPEALAVIEKRGSNASDTVFHLFCRPKNAGAEQWEGARSGIQAALDVFNADEAIDINRIQHELPKLLKGVDKIYTDLPRSSHPKSSFSRYLSSLPLRPSDGVSKSLPSTVVKPLRFLMNQLRVIKSPAEIELMRKVGQASGRAITDVMRQSWMSEKALQARLEYGFSERGMNSVGYIPVVAAGQNAGIIHYVRSESLIDTDDMILLDAGAQYGGYITDVSRTWPNSGKFSPAQKDLYSAVLDVQREAIAKCREDQGMTLDRVHSIAERKLKENLKDLGFDMSGNAIVNLFPHHIGHYIGLDVHDSPGYLRSASLTKGMCVTIEPGVYVPNHDSDERYPKHFRGMGIRIEDSLCVDTEGPFVFSMEAVKEIEDIEALRRSGMS